eukprot:TRINITY_DN65783_c0_g1_i1.p1 TRINITY_DN65783_c0_g1~~TRINITY_DN65783_c0_g1_i1.p1  ORF type:complete len:305 (-),score=26.79 TRINITY_DN65783_c0_g1_i1:18-887(-)
MAPLYECLELGANDVFYDLGCGVGKLVLYVALRGCRQSVGLEIGERRQAIGAGVFKAFAHQLDCQQKGSPSSIPTVGNNCGSFEVQLGDISRRTYSNVTVAVITNLCMDMGVQNRTVESLLKCPTVRRIVTITPLVPHSRLKLRRAVPVACTWAKISSWHVYDVVEPLSRASRVLAARLQRTNSQVEEPKRIRPRSMPSVCRKAKDTSEAKVQDKNDTLPMLDGKSSTGSSCCGSRSRLPSRTSTRGRLATTLERLSPEPVELKSPPTVVLTLTPPGSAGNINASFKQL